MLTVGVQSCTLRGGGPRCPGIRTPLATSRIDPAPGRDEAPGSRPRLPSRAAPCPTRPGGPATFLPWCCRGTFRRGWAFGLARATRHDSPRLSPAACFLLLSRVWSVARLAASGHRGLAACSARWVLAAGSIDAHSHFHPDRLHRALPKGLGAVPWNIICTGFIHGISRCCRRLPSRTAPGSPSWTCRDPRPRVARACAGVGLYVRFTETTRAGRSRCAPAGTQTGAGSRGPAVNLARRNQNLSTASRPAQPGLRTTRAGLEIFPTFSSSTLATRIRQTG